MQEPCPENNVRRPECFQYVAIIAGMEVNPLLVTVKPESFLCVCVFVHLCVFV